MWMSDLIFTKFYDSSVFIYYFVLQFSCACCIRVSTFQRYRNVLTTFWMWGILVIILFLYWIFFTPQDHSEGNLIMILLFFIWIFFSPQGRSTEILITDSLLFIWIFFPPQGYSAGSLITNILLFSLFCLPRRDTRRNFR